MGTSISTTRTLERLQSQRDQRSQGQNTKKTKKNDHLIPLHKRETQRENLPINNPQQQSKNSPEFQDLQNFSIRLNTHQYKTSVQTKNSYQKNNENRRSLLPKQSFKETTPPEQKEVTRKFVHESQNYSPSLHQQTTFNSKFLQKISQIQSQNKAESPIKPVAHLQTKKSEVLKQNISDFQPTPLIPPSSHLADKQMSEKERKRKQEAIKYIKDSQFLTGKKELSNNVYQVKSMTPRKVEELLPSQRNYIDLSPNVQQKGKVFMGSPIKLTPEQEELDLPPKSSNSARKKVNSDGYSINNVRRY